MKFFVEYLEGKAKSKDAIINKISYVMREVSNWIDNRKCTLPKDMVSKLESNDFKDDYVFKCISVVSEAYNSWRKSGRNIYVFSEKLSAIHRY